MPYGAPPAVVAVVVVEQEIQGLNLKKIFLQKGQLFVYRRTYQEQFLLEVVGSDLQNVVAVADAGKQRQVW